MKTLTAEDTAVAKARLSLIQAMRKEADERLAYSKSAEFQVEKDEYERIAFLTITSGIYDAASSQVSELAEFIGLNDADPDEQLAQVIELFDGNRRRSGLNDPPQG